MDRAHEALAASVDQHRAFAAQRLGGERGRVAADIDGGRMELHELGVGDHRAGPGGDGDAFAARLARIGGDGVDLAGAAGREHHGARRQDEPRRRDVGPTWRRARARHAAVAQPRSRAA